MIPFISEIKKMINLPSGQEDFRQLRENGNILYVDKTYFIKEWWESYDKVTLISRPKCFGKTLNMSMLDYFFSNQYTNTRHLFTNLFISSEREIMEHQNQHPVIFLSFNDLKNGDFDFVKSQIKMKIWQIYLLFKNQLMESDHLDVTEKLFVESMKPDMSDFVAIHSIQYLCNFLNKVYENQRAIVILDEYDILFSENWSLSTFCEEIKNFCFNFISSTFKDNKCMLKGIITGVMNIALYTNNISFYTMASTKYSNCFGFTKDEVFELAKLYNFESKIDEIEKWYGGYLLDNSEVIYNPFSIIHFLNEPNTFSNFWFSTINNNFLREILKEGNLNIKDSLIKLIQGKCIRKELSRNSVLYDCNVKNEESIWIFFLSYGYLTIEKVEDSRNCGKLNFTLKFPNCEVGESFNDLVVEMFNSLNLCLNEFIEFLFASDFLNMESFVNGYFERCLSFFDHSQFNSEIIFHTLVLGVAANIQNLFDVSLCNQNANGECFYVVLKPSTQEQHLFILLFKKQFECRVTNSLKSTFNKICQHEIETINFPSEKVKKFIFVFNSQECKVISEEALENMNIENDHEDELLASNKSKSRADLSVGSFNFHDRYKSHKKRKVGRPSISSPVVLNTVAPTVIAADYVNPYNTRSKDKAKEGNTQENNANETNDNNDNNKNKEEEEIDDFEDDDDDDDREFKMSSYGSHYTKKKKDGFDRRKFTSFHLKDEVYVIDPNGVDLWEGIIINNKPGSIFGIHYPGFPNDDEIIKGCARLLRRTPINDRIFHKQEELRNKLNVEKAFERAGDEEHVNNKVGPSHGDANNVVVESNS